VNQSFSGGCLCGASRFVANGEPLNVRVCHCRLCQKALGAAFNARVLMDRKAVELSGPIRRANSSPELARGFCELCGTTLFSERKDPAVIGLTLGSLDDPNQFAPAEHIWTSSKQSLVEARGRLAAVSGGLRGACSLRQLVLP
jgi:hypothetical protein